MQYMWSFLLNQNLLSGKKRFFHGAILKANLSWGKGIPPRVGNLQPSYLIQEGKKDSQQGKYIQINMGNTAGREKVGSRGGKLHH